MTADPTRALCAHVATLAYRGRKISPGPGGIRRLPSRRSRHQDPQCVRSSRTSATCSTGRRAWWGRDDGGRRGGRRAGTWEHDGSFLRCLQKVDAALASDATPSCARKIFQVHRGRAHPPGQLALLRRLAGAPVRGE